MFRLRIVCTSVNKLLAQCGQVRFFFFIFALTAIRIYYVLGSRSNYQDFNV